MTRAPESGVRRLAAVLLILGPLFAAGTSSFLLFPSRFPVPVIGAERRSIPNGRGHLEAWIARTPRADTDGAGVRILAFCENASRAEWLVTRIASLAGDRAVEIWAVNYPGYGGSDGKAELGLIGAAADAAADAVMATEPRLPIVCWGESLGATAALFVAASRPVDGLVVFNPPPLRRLIMTRHGWWNLWIAAGIVALQVPSALEALETAPEATSPALFVTARGDSIVPPDCQDLVFDAYGGPKRRVFVAGDHNDWLGGEEAAALRSALNELLDGVGSSDDSVGRAAAR